ADRYPSASALAEALADWARRQPDAAPAGPRGPDLLQDTAVPGYTPPASSDTPAVRARPAGPPVRRPSPRVLAGLAAGAAALTAAGVLLVLWATGRLNGPAPPPGGGEPAAETGPELPRTQQRDFRLQVEMFGGREGPNGRRLFSADEPA